MNVKWSPITDSDQADVPADNRPLPFELDEVDRAHAAAARHYLEQHRQKLNERNPRKELTR